MYLLFCTFASLAAEPSDSEVSSFVFFAFFAANIPIPNHADPATCCCLRA